MQTGRGRLRADLPQSGSMFHFLRCNGMAFLLLGAVASFWWVGARISQEREANRTQESAGKSSRQRKHPQKSKAVVNNNWNAELQLPPNLEGTAVLYPEEVDALVRPDGTFCTELPASELARRLGVELHRIARMGSKDEVDPNVVLFNVVTGRLSERAKAQARQTRAAQARMGIVASAVGDEWVKTKLGLTLNALLHPSADEREVLEAICRSALNRRRQSGAKINAVPLLFDRDPERSVFSGGFLPLEASPEGIAALADANG